jgi:hypothetical protein
MPPVHQSIPLRFEWSFLDFIPISCFVCMSTSQMKRNTTRVHQSQLEMNSPGPEHPIDPISPDTTDSMDVQLPFVPPVASPSIHPRQPRPARSPMHASAEVYGFCIYVSTFVGALLYLIWALVPDQVLHSWGITYYPSKWWALAVPAWFCVTLASVPLFYFLINMTFTIPFDHPNQLTDGWSAKQKQKKKRHQPLAHTSSSKHPHHIATSAERYSIPDVVDIPLAQINALLYSAHNTRTS